MAGRILTNFETIQGCIRRLKELEESEQKGVFQVLTKKEASLKLKSWRDYARIWMV